MPSGLSYNFCLLYLSLSPNIHAYGKIATVYSHLPRHPPSALGFFVHSLSSPPPHHMLLILIIFLKDCDPCCIWVMTAPLLFPLNTSHQEAVLTHRARTSPLHKVVERETLKTMNIYKFVISVPVTYAY